MSEPRRLDHLPLGGEGGLPYSKGLLARALVATGLSSVHAWELALRVEDDLELRRETSVDLERLEELAQDVLGRERRCRRGTPAAPLPRVAGPRSADRRPRRRRHRHGEVARRDGGRVPARHHARHVHRLHPPDDARVLLGGVHAVDPLLELRGRPGRTGGGRPDARRLPRPDAERPRRRACRHRAGAARGLVDGARGRPSRARAGAAHRGRARGAVRARDRERGHPRRPLLGA